jgi:hypothetical protein
MKKLLAALLLTLSLPALAALDVSPASSSTTRQKSAPATR